MESDRYEVGKRGQIMWGLEGFYFQCDEKLLDGFGARNQHIRDYVFRGSLFLSFLIFLNIILCFIKIYLIIHLQNLSFNDVCT